MSKARAIDPGCRITADQLDVRDPQAVERVADRVLEEFGTVDVLVANAGVNSNGLLVSMSDEEWNRVIETNLTGTFYLSRQFLPTFLANRFGRIIIMSSLGYSGVSGQAGYAASKAGLLGCQLRSPRSMAARASRPTLSCPVSSTPTSVGRT